MMGAAYLAGIGAGVWQDREEVRGTWEVDRRFEPTWSEDERSSRYAEWRDAVRRALSPGKTG